MSDTEETAGRVTITWSESVTTPYGPMPTMLAVHDAGTGELMPVFAISLCAGDPVFGCGPKLSITAEITELLGEDGRPVRAGGTPAITEEYREHLTRVATKRRGRAIRDLTPQQCSDLDAFQASFTGQEFQTVTRLFTVAAMRFAGP